MQESEEHYSLLLSEENGKVEAVEKDFRSAFWLAVVDRFAYLSCLLFSIAA